MFAGVEHTLKVENGTVHHRYTLTHHQEGVLQSQDFPLCCNDSCHTIVCESTDHHPCYIRMVFTDLDLAGGSVLHVSDLDMICIIVSKL